MAKVLIIDDEQDFVDLLVIRLRAMGYEPLFAYDGAEGLRISSANKPDVILLDLMMPIMDGLTFLTKIKQDEKTKTIPVLVLTASGNLETAKQAMKLGAINYITKPFEPADLAAKIKNVLPGG